MLHQAQVSKRTRPAPAVWAGLVLAAFAAASPAWGTEPADHPLGPTSIDPPAAPGSSLPALAAEGATTVAKGHDVLMTWLEPGESGGKLRFARYSERTWTRPITVAERVSTFDAADRPSLTVFDTQAVRRTLIARTGDVVARTGDAGRTWTRLPSPGLPFASFAGGDEGGYAFWLDAGGDGSARLLGTRVLAGESLLDPRAAGGSSTAAAMTWDGPLVVYRDQSPQGVQDVAVVRRQDARWTLPRPVHVERWRPDRPPSAGPRVAALRRQVAVAWYTEAWHRPRVLVAFSNDAGRTFDEPVEVDAQDGDHRPSPSVDVALAEGGDALVLWMAATGPREAALRLARVSPDGHRGEGLVLAEGLAGHPSDMPQMVSTGEDVVVTWLDNDSRLPAPGRMRAVAIPLAAIPATGDGRPVTADAGAATAEPDAGQGQIGDRIPEFELRSLDGEVVSLASLRGRAVLLNLWATWCLPCIAEMPELAALHERYGSQGLTVVGLNVDGAATAAKVPAFVAERTIPYAIWLDPELRLHGALRVRTLPVTLVIDRDGHIISRRDGTIAADDPELAKALDRALGDS